MSHSASQSEQQPPTSRLSTTLVVTMLAAAPIVIITSVVWWMHREALHETIFAETAYDVPLGVEEAAIIRYTGPELVARPYRRGASINLRIARKLNQEGPGVYDVRYVVNLPGEFNLVDYLASADGSPVDDLPAFVVRGQTRLTKDIETRIREIEKVEINIPHRYYELLVGLGIVWAAWLLGLIFVGRPKGVVQQATPVPLPSVRERINRLLRELKQRELTVDEKSRLEQLLLQHWASQLEQRQSRLSATCRSIQRHQQLAPAYDILQTWLHHPSSEIGQQQVIEACSPSAPATMSSI